MLAEKFGHESFVPLKAEQGLVAPIQPTYPFQMQFLTRPVGGYQRAQAASLVAIIFEIQDLRRHAVLFPAVAILLQGPSDPVNV